MTTPPDFPRPANLWRRLAGRVAVGIMVLAVLTACGIPFGIGQPTTRALESGAVDSVDATASFRITGSYTESGNRRTIDLELARPSSLHLLLKGGPADLEAIVTANSAYFRGRDFLSSHMGSDSVSRALVQATGGGWWKGPASYVPQLPDFTEGKRLSATFLGPAVTTRTDHVSVGDAAAVELSGPRADVFVAEAPPFRLLRLQTKAGSMIDGISDADLRFGDFDRDFGIVAPSGAINFADQSTLPPIYTVMSVDTSGCTLPCVVSGLLKNVGGQRGAGGTSKVIFTMIDPQTNSVLGTCTAGVQLDVEHNATTKVSCTIAGLNGGDHNAAVITAVADSA